MRYGVRGYWTGIRSFFIVATLSAPFRRYKSQTRSLSILKRIEMWTSSRSVSESEKKCTWIKYWRREFKNFQGPCGWRRHHKFVKIGKNVLARKKSSFSVTKIDRWLGLRPRIDQERKRTFKDVEEHARMPKIIRATLKTFEIDQEHSTTFPTLKVLFNPKSECSRSGTNLIKNLVVVQNIIVAFASEARRGIL